MEDENLELSNYIFFYKEKIDENGIGIIYQKVDNNIVSTNQQIQNLYIEIQNIIPEISFQLKFKNDIYENSNDNNYYVDIVYYDNVKEDVKKYVENQLIIHIKFNKVDI